MRHAYSLLAVFTLFWSTTVNAAERPNIVLIFIDDMGWMDVGCYGNDFIETPRIDQLAGEGVRFTDFYAAGAVCSPTRCALQSGQNQARIGITDFISGHWRPFERVTTPRPTMALPLNIVTVAESLKAVGYTTGYVGKWHLGNGPMYQPDKQGYDFSAVIGGPHLPGMYRVQGRPDLKPETGQYRTDFEADLCINFIQENRKKPFFLMLSPYAVHIPLAAMSAKVDKYKAKAAKLKRDLPHPVYAAMVEHCDEMVGRIVDAVDAAGLTEKTMIVFTSDNGGLYRRYDYNPEADDTVAVQAPLRGEKGSLHEGGVRVPLIVKYPPRTKAGTECSEPTVTYDFYPTFVELAGGRLPKNQPIDGRSLLSLMQKADAKLDRQAIHWHYPHYHHDRPASSIRERDWKLIEYLDGTGDLELYNLANDIGESQNLAAEKKGRTADLKKKLQAWRHSVLAAMPLPNPSYDAKRAGEWWSPRTGKPVPSASRKRFPATEKERR
ncbi:MAG: arylsulfatase [Planctomycetaceae bacterium]|nr:arylsulfatase [Planctomycetaceae bacterium]